MVNPLLFGSELSIIMAKGRGWKIPKEKPNGMYSKASELKFHAVESEKIETEQANRLIDSNKALRIRFSSSWLMKIILNTTIMDERLKMILI